MSGKLAIPRFRGNRWEAAVESNQACQVCIHKAVGLAYRSCCMQGYWQCRTRGMAAALPDHMRGMLG